MPDNIFGLILAQSVCKMSNKELTLVYVLKRDFVKSPVYGHNTIYGSFWSCLFEAELKTTSQIKTISPRNTLNIV